MTTHRNLIIIGSGPAGYTAALYAARADLRPLLLEGGDMGGALMNTTEVENFPGFPDAIMGPELMMQFRLQAEKFGAEMETEDVVEVDLAGPVKCVRTETAEYTADAVILAMGSAYRHLGIERETELSGRGVSWCATCDGAYFRGMDVVVVGGGDTAMEEADFLSRYVSTVTMVHRREELRASRIMVDRVAANEKVRWIYNAEVIDIRGDEAVEGVRLRDTRSGAEQEIDARALFVAIGHEPRSQLVLGQVDVDDQGYVLTGVGTRTNLDGVFAAGDLVDHTYRQAITAAGSGCQAALDAQHFLSARAAASSSISSGSAR